MPLTQQQIQEAFQLFDKDGSGQISATELSQVMCELGYQLSADQIQQVLQVIDRDGSGQISLDEFVQFVRAAEEHPSCQQ